MWRSLVSGFTSPKPNWTRSSKRGSPMRHFSRYIDGPIQRDAIINLYKEYMENESILFNKLKMMANDRKNSENDSEGWIVQTGGLRADAKDHPRSQFKKEEEALKLKYKNYNFLEDRERKGVDLLSVGKSGKEKS